MADTTISVRIDEQLRRKMKMHEEINWSAVIRRMLVEELKKQETAKKEKIRKAIESIDKIRESKAFDNGKSSVEIIREWRNKHKS